MWVKLLYAGFETWLGWDPPAPKVLGANPISNADLLAPKRGRGVMICNWVIG